MTSLADLVEDAPTTADRANVAKNAAGVIDEQYHRLLREFLDRKRAGRDELLLLNHVNDALVELQKAMRAHRRHLGLE